jgi:hypothetical protein
MAGGPRRLGKGRMINAHGVRNDDARQQLLIIGLSNENVARLLRGGPIVMDRRTHGDGVPEGWQIVLFNGATEEDMAKDLRRIGAVDGAKIINDPHLGRPGGGS